MGVPGKRTVDRWDYRAYIQSPEWRAKRDQYWSSQMPKNCYVCDAPRSKGMHLHHRTYKNLGAERLMDLVPVCAGCHEAVHEIYAQPRFQRAGLWFATKEARRRLQSSSRKRI